MKMPRHRLHQRLPHLELPQPVMTKVMSNTAALRVDPDVSSLSATQAMNSQTGRMKRKRTPHNRSPSITKLYDSKLPNDDRPLSFSPPQARCLNNWDPPGRDPAGWEPPPSPRQVKTKFCQPVLAPQAHTAVYDTGSSSKQVQIRWSSRKSRQGFTLQPSDGPKSRFRHYTADRTK
jgi:hypothetical protein